MPAHQRGQCARLGLPAGQRVTLGSPSPTPTSAEMVAARGATEAVTLDLQHGLFDHRTTVHAIRAIRRAGELEPGPTPGARRRWPGRTVSADPLCLRSSARDGLVRSLFNCSASARCGRGNTLDRRTVSVDRSRPAEKLLGEPEVLEDALDPWLLGLEEGRECLGRLVHVHPAALLHPEPAAAPLCAVLPSASSSASRSSVRDPLGTPWGRAEWSGSTSTPCSLKVGMSTPGRRSGEEIASARSFQPPAASELVEPAGRDRDVRAHDLGRHLAAGARDDVVHLGPVAADRLDGPSRTAGGRGCPARSRPRTTQPGSALYFWTSGRRAS